MEAVRIQGVEGKGGFPNKAMPRIVGQAKGAVVIGQGVLIVNGNLVMDVTNGFNYFGLIVVTGNVTMTANPSASANPHIHGAIIAGGQFNAPISNFGGSISIHQNACLVQTAFGGLSYRTVAVRELMY